MKIPWPPIWNDSIDGIDTRQWARDHELSLLPSNTIFPCGDQVWETVRDCEVHIIVAIDHVLRGGGIARLRQGERVRVFPIDDPKPLSVAIQPLRDELHASIVPEDIRRTPGYTHYWLSVKTAYLNEHFRLVEDVA